jgi:hydroxyacylglutathione hydrolase
MDSAPLIERLWVGNAGRNFNYLVACPRSGEALVIDPLDADLCLRAARDKGWRITQVLNTHEHSDHIGGNAAVRAATGARLLAHPRAAARVGLIDQPLADGDLVTVGDGVRLRVIETPGHAPAHVVLRATAGPALFCGDILFNAGVGNCTRGGDPAALFQTLQRLRAELPPQTVLHPGHDYMRRNLAFALDREPDNAAARRWSERIENIAVAPTTTLEEEHAFNPYLRLNSASLRHELQQALPGLGADASDRDVFVALRQLRDRW